MSATLLARPPHAPADAPPARRWLILALVCCAQFLAAVDDTIVNTALPSIGADLGFGERRLSWVVNAYLLGFGGFLLLGGRAADVLGRARVFRTGVGLFTMFSVLAGVAASAELLIGARGLQGLSAAMLSPAALAIVVTTFPAGRERTTALGVWAALLGLGAATGLVAGGALTETAGWRWVFFINAPIGVAVLAASLRVLPADPPPARRARLDAPGAVLATAGLLAIVFTVVEAPEVGWGSARTLIGLALGAGLLVAFARHEQRAPAPLVPPAVVRRRAVAVANGVTLLAAAGLYAMFFFMTLFMQVVLGWSPLRAGLSGLGFSVVFLLVSGLATRLVERVPARAMIAAGSGVAAIGLLLWARTDPQSGYVDTILPAMSVAAIGMGLAFVPLTAAATSAATGPDAGIVSGLLSTSQQIGGAIGVAVLVTIASSETASMVAAGTPQMQAISDGFHVAFRIDAVVLLAAALLAPLLGRVRVTGPPLPA
jgi:EmrB/QacA subfamily drug resistance transporter